VLKKWTKRLTKKLSRTIKTKMKRAERELMPEASVVEGEEEDAEGEGGEEGRMVEEMIMIKGP
jgi:hypothetical protein